MKKGGADQVEKRQAIPLEEAVPPQRGCRLPSAVAIVATAFGLFHLYTGGFGIIPGLRQRVIHLGFALTLTFLLRPLSKDRPSGRRGLVADVLLALLCGAISIYAFFQIIGAAGLQAGMSTRWDVILGVLLLILLLEGTRRVIGLGLPVIAAIFLVYAFYGPYFPGLIGHRGYDVERITQQLFLSDEGIYGLPLGVSANYIVLFIIFGSFLQASGGGKFFIDFSYSLCGWFRGGPAKMAIFASSLFGTISGSAVANAGAVGPFTIPLMKRVGFKPVYAAAVESVASCGGQIMPPVMGAAAFLISEILGMPYIHLAIAAAVPAIFYYLALFMMVDFSAGKEGIQGIPKKDLPILRHVLTWGWHLTIPPFILVYLLVVEERSPMAAAFGAIMGILIVSAVRKSSRMGWRKILVALQNGAIGSIEVATACACAGVVIGIFTLTGLGMKFSTVLIDLAQGNLLALLFLTMLASLLLGTGLPTLPTYVILAILVAPALVKMGVLPIAAHLFIFYFGAISDMTPPLAISAYVAAGIAQADPLRTTIMASKLGLAGYILPFMFVYSPALLLKGTFGEILLAALSGFVAISALAACLQGFLLDRLNFMERAFLLLGACALIFPGYWSDLIGYLTMGFIFLKQCFYRSKGKKKSV